MRGDAGEPLGLGRLLFRVLVVPGLVVALALAVVMAAMGGFQGGARDAAVSVRHAHRTRPAPSPGSPAEARTAASVRRALASSGPRAPARPRVGVYVGPGAATRASAYSSLLPTGINAAFDYLGASSWASIASPAWLVGRWAPTRYAMTFAVPMLPVSGASLAAGASGAYDDEFRALARILVANGDASATLVLGWSPLEGGLPWSVSSVAEGADYVAYFRHIVRAMREVRGARFVFAFQPGPVSPALRGVVGPGRIYPGNRYVGVVAAQVFDELAPPSPVEGARRWARIRSVPFGPAWTARFAARLHRRLVVDGLALVPVDAGGGGDDPAFVAAFFAWARRVDVAEVTLWADGSWAFTPSRDPRAFARLRALIVGG